MPPDNTQTGQLEIVLKFADEGVSRGLKDLQKNLDSASKSAEASFGGKAGPKALRDYAGNLAEISKNLRFAGQSFDLAGKALSAFNVKTGESLRVMGQAQIQAAGLGNQLARMLTPQVGLAASLSAIALSGRQLQAALALLGDETVRGKDRALAFNAAIGSLATGVAGLSTVIISAQSQTGVLGAGLQRIGDTARATGAAVSGALVAGTGQAEKAFAALGGRFPVVASTMGAVGVAAAQTAGKLSSSGAAAVAMVPGLATVAAKAGVFTSAMSGAAGATAMGAKAFLSYLPLIGTVASGIAIASSAIGKHQEATARGESSWKAMAIAVGDGLLVMGRSAAFLGGPLTLALYAVGEAAVRVSAKIMDFNLSLITLQVEAGVKLAQALMHPIDAMHEFGAVAKQVATETVQAIDSVISAIPGPISQAKDLMVGGMGAAASGMQKATTAATTLLSGLAALSFEMRQSESVYKAFELSMSKMGISGGELVKTVQAESKGLVSQIEIMEKANTAVSLIGEEALNAIGGADKALSQMVQVSMAAARATGNSVEFMFDSLVTGIGRASPLILDNLGLGLKLGDTYEKAAKGLGKSTQAMTLTEQKVALLNEALGQGMKQVARYGITSGGVNTQVQLFNVTLKDLALNIALAFSPALRDLLVVVNQFMLIVRQMLPYIEQAIGIFVAIPVPIRNAALAFAALNVAMNLLSTGPAQQLLGILGMTGDSMGAILASARILAPVLLTLFSMWQANAFGVQDAMAELAKSAEGAFAPLKSRLGDVAKAWQNLVSQLTLMKPMASSAIHNILFGDVEKGAQQLGQLLSNVYAQFQKFFASLLMVGQSGGAQIAGAWVSSFIGNLIKRIGEIANTVVPLLLNEGARWVRAIADGIVAAIGFLEEMITGAGKALGDKVVEGLGNIDGEGILSAVGNIISALGEAAGRIYTALVALVAQAWQEAINFLITAGPAILEAIAGMAEQVAAALPGVLATITDTLLGWVDAAVDGIYKFFTEDLVSAVDGGVGDSVDRIQSATGRLIEAVLNWITESGEKLKERWPEWEEKLTEVWEEKLQPAILKFLGEAGKFIGENVGIIWASLPGQWKLGAVAWALGFNGWKTTALVLIWKFRGELWDAFKTALTSLWDSLPTVIETGGINVQMALENLLGLLLDGVTGLIGGLLSGLASALSFGLIDLGATWQSGILSWAGQIFLALWELQARITLEIQNVLAGLLSYLVGYFFGLGIWLSNKFTELVNRVKVWWASLTAADTWTGFWENLKANLSLFAETAWATLKQEALDLYNNAVGYFTDLGARLGDAFLRGAQAGAGEAWSLGGGGGGPLPGLGGAGYAAPGTMQGPLAPSGGKGAPSAPGVPSAPSVPAGPGDGKGGKGAKDKAGGAGGQERQVDPVKEAFEKISTISNAVRDGIAAMKAVWTEFLGAPPSALMDQVFDALNDFAQRGIELARDLDVDVLELPAIKGALEVLQSTLQGFQSAIDAGNAVFKARMPSQDRVKAIFGVMRSFAEEGLSLAEELTSMGLEEAVKASAMGQEMGKVITGVADAVIKSAEATGAIAKGRWDVDFAPVRTFFMGAIGLATEASAEFTRLSGEALLPRAVAESDMVAKSVAAWTDNITKSAEAAVKMEQTRYPADLAEPRKLLGQVLEMGLEITQGFTQRFGDQFMIVAEDMGIVASALDAFIGPITGVADAAQAIFKTRAGATLAPARDLLIEVLEIGLDLVSRLPADTILRVAEDLMVTAGALDAWMAPLAAIPDVVRAAEVALTRPMPVQPMRDLLDSILQMAVELTEAQLSRITGKIALALNDMKAVGDGLAVWLGLISGLDDVVASVEQAAFQTRWRGASENIEAAGAILMAIGKMAWELTSAASGKLDIKTMLQTLEDGILVAQAFTAWLEPLKGLGEALASARIAGGTRNPEATLAFVGRILRAVGAEAWALIKDVIAGPGLADVQAASQTIASTYAVWIDTFTAAADFTLALRQMRTGEVGQHVLYLRLLLGEIAAAGWELIKGAIATPGVNELQQASQAIAATYGAWLEVVTGGVDLSRKLRAFKQPETGWEAGIRSFLVALGSVAEELTNTWINSHYANPTGEAGIMGAVAGMLAEWASAFVTVADSSRTIRHFIEPTERDWASILAAVRGLWDRFRPLTEEYIKDLYDWGLEAAPKVTAWSKAVGEIAGAVKDVLDLGIRNYVEPTAREWDAVEVAMSELWRRFHGIAQDVMPAVVEDAQDAALHTTAWRDAVGAMAGAVSDVAGIQLHNYVEPLDREWSAVKRSLMELWGRFTFLADYLMPDLLPQAEDLALALGHFRNAVGAIAEAVLSAAGIQLHLYIEPTAAEFEMVGRALANMWRVMKPLALRLMPELLADSEDLAKKLELWQQSVAAMVGAIVEAAGVILLRENVAAVSMDAVRVLKGNISVFFAEFGVMAREWAAGFRVPETAAQEIELWSSSAGAIMDALGSALEIAQKMAGELVPKLPREGMLNRLKTTIQFVFKLFGELTDPKVMTGQAKGAGADPRRSAAEQEESWRRFQAFSESLQAQIGGLTDTIDFLTKLADQGHKLITVSATAKSILRQAITAITGLWLGLADDFEQGSVEARAAVSRAAGFASSVGELVKPLGDITDAILKIDAFIWETIQVINGAAPGSPAAPQSYGMRKVEEVTPSGFNRYRRVVRVAQEDIRRILELAKMFMDETRVLMDQMIKEFEVRDPDGEFEKFMADLGGFMEKATQAADLAVKTSEAIEALFNSALTVSIFAGRGGMREWTLVTPSWLKVRERRADWAATQLKESFKRQVRTLVNAVKESLAEVQGEIPTQEMVGPLNNLVQIVTAVANAITQVMEMPTIETARIQSLVNAMNLLSGIILPEWMFKDVIGTTLSNLMLLLDKLNVIDPERVREAILALSGLSFSPSVMEIPTEKLEALANILEGLKATGGGGNFGRGGANGPATPDSGAGVSEAIVTSLQEIIVGTLGSNGRHISLPPPGPELVEPIASMLVASLQEIIVGTLGSNGRHISLPPPGPDVLEPIVEAFGTAMTVIRDMVPLAWGQRGSLPPPGPQVVEPIVTVLGNAMQAVLDAATLAWGQRGSLPPPPGTDSGGGAGGGFDVPGMAALDWEALGRALGAAIPAPEVDVLVDVQPAQIDLFASLEFPEAAYDLIARRVRENERGPVGQGPPKSIGGGKPGTTKPKPRGRNFYPNRRGWG